MECNCNFGDTEHAVRELLLSAAGVSWWKKPNTNLFRVGSCSWLYNIFKCVEVSEKGTMCSDNLWGAKMDKKPNAA